MAAAVKCKTSAEENSKVKDIDQRNLIIPYPHSHIVSPASMLRVFSCAQIYVSTMTAACCVVVV